MTTEWRDLPTMADVAAAQAAGDEIETRYYECAWEPWKGYGWVAAKQYRARPRQPKMKKVKSLCWRSKDRGDCVWMDERFEPPEYWQRFPAGDIEDEVEDDN